MQKQEGSIVFEFDRYDQRRLQSALQKVWDKRTFLRLRAVLLVAQGKAVYTVAKLLGRTARAIYYWVDTYLNTHNPQDLLESPRSGRPRVAKTLTEEHILAALTENPLHLGYHTTVWTVALLAAHLNHCHGAAISPRTLRRRMKQAGLRFKRPRYVYSEKDPHRAQKKGPLCET
jgi:transposase